MGVLRRTQRRRQSVEPRAVRGWGPAGRKQDPKSQKFSLKDSLELAELLLSSALRVSARFPSKPRGEAAFRPAPSFSHCVRHPRVCLSYHQFPVASAGGAWVSAAPRAQGCLACPCPVASANLGSCPVQGRCIPRTPQLGQYQCNAQRETWIDPYPVFAPWIGSKNWYIGNPCPSGIWALR